MKLMFLRKQPLLILSLLLLGSVAHAAPDLIVSKVSSPNLDGGVIKVAVKNQGDTAATPFYMAIQVTPAGRQMKVFSPAMPALAAGQETEVEVQTGFGLSQAKYVAIADRSNTVKESKENNNTLSGQFGGKP